MCALLLYVVLLSLSAVYAKPPNIVFIVADDLGWNDVGWHNHEIFTPNLNKLAQDGVILNSSYVQPVCSPSRGAFMTGYFPFHIGLQHKVIRPNYGYGVPLNKTLLPQRLKALGYDTHAVGKWHLGFCNWNYTPTYRGFDSFYGYYCGAEDYYTHTRGNGLDFRFNKDVERDQNGIYSAYSFAKRATDIIHQHNTSKPLFLYLPFQSVHNPLQVPKKYELKYKHIKHKARRTRLGMITAMDEAIGNVTQALKENALLDNTLIVFTSDNGGPVESLSAANNWPLRGGKHTVWEGGTKVAAFVWGNMIKKRSYTNMRMIHAVDWFPTLVELAGGEPEAGIDGVSQWRSLSEDAPSARTDFVYNIDELSGLWAIRSGDYKYMEGRIPCPCGWVPPPDYNCKETNTSTQINKQDSYLFNIADDPLERNDLSARLPDVVRSMRARIKRYMKTLHPAFPPVPNPESDPAKWGGVWSPGWC